MKKLLISAVLLFLFVEAKTQDTIRVKYVTENIYIISKKHGDTLRVFHKKRKVKLGYIIKEKSGLYVVNGYEMKLNNIRQLNAKYKRF